MFFKFVLGLLCICDAIAFSMPLRMSNTNKSNNRRDFIKKTFIVTPMLQIVQKSIPVQAYTKDELDHIQLYDRLMQSSCYISTEYAAGEQTKNPLQDKLQGKPQGIGSGFLWDTQGHVVTNFHVINKAENATIIFTRADGSKHQCTPRLTGVDPDHDLAVLKVDMPLPFTNPISVSSNKNIKIGSYCFALGNPFGKMNSFSMGIVSGLQRDIRSPSGHKINDIIQTDADINPGNSGGPLVDSDGRLIGVCTSTMGLGVSSGVNFAVSVDTVKKVVTQIIKNGNIQRPVLGISYLFTLPSKQDAANGKFTYVEKGIIITDVAPNSPAYQAGLQGAKNNTLGDVIVAIDDIPVNNPDDFNDVLEKYKPNDVISLNILRGNLLRPMTLQLKLGAFQSGVFSKLQPDK